METDDGAGPLNGYLKSFDVFDTVLTRLVGCPASAFLLVGHAVTHAGLWPATPERFASARIAAEDQARRHVHPIETTLDRIYQELAFAYALSSGAAKAMAALEVQIEDALIYAVPTARRLIDEGRIAGNRIAFISDTYFAKEVVGGWLLREKLLTQADTFWVSSESGSTKASGALFDQIRPDVPASWSHLGDHPVSDVARPRERGIEANLWEACRLTRYEEQMERHALATGGMASLLAGSARWLRLNHPAMNAAQATLRDIAAGVAGPVMWAFVTWVLVSAHRDGLRQIWFTARDGQVMLRMARQIAPRLGIDLRMGYLYAGRQVVHLAGLQCIDEQALKWMTGGAGVISAAAVLERVGLTVETMSEALRRHNILLEGPIGWASVAALNDFFRDEEVQAAVLRVAAGRRNEMRDYFGACGLMGDSPCAIVDIGWRGSVLRSIFDIIGLESAAQHSFMYFGLYARPGDVPEARMSAYCFDASTVPATGVGNDIPSLTGLMEIMCQADHAQVLQVESTAGGYKPILRSLAPHDSTQWDVAYFQNCLESFAMVVPLELAPDSSTDLRPMCDQLMRLLMLMPDDAEAAVLGSVQFVDDQGGSLPQPFAQPYRLSDLRATLRSGEPPQKSLAAWAQGAWALTPFSTRACLRLVQRLRSVVRPNRI